MASSPPSGPVIELCPIFAEFGDCIAIQVNDNGNIQHFLVDGGPTTAHDGPPPKVYWYLFRYLTTQCLQSPSVTDFSLNGIVVTHPDGDHIEGIIKLLEKFPPNKDQGSGSFKFVFNGPVLITTIFDKVPKGEELIKLLTDSGFTKKAIASNPFQDGNFTFHFEDTSPGVLYNHNPQHHSTSSFTAPAVAFMTLGAGKVTKARHTVDDSEANASSIITTWDTGHEYAFVLTGDAPGYRILKALKQSGPSVTTKPITFFQVPHHGSARNSLPLDKNQLPSEPATNLVQQMIAFSVILGYSLEDSKGNPKVLTSNLVEKLKQWVGTKLMENLDKAALKGFGARIIKALNENKAITNVPKNMSKAMFVFIKACAALEAVSSQVKQYIQNQLSASIVDVFNVTQEISDLFKPSGKYLYTATVETAMEEIRKLPTKEWSSYRDIDSMLSGFSVPFLDQVLPSRVADLYKQFHAEIYYISSSTNHGHPSSATISGIIEAAMNSKKPCTVLLSSGYALPPRSLDFPNFNVWKDLVTIQYFTQPYAKVNLQTKTLQHTQVFNPTNYNPKAMNQLRQNLQSGAAAHFFSKDVAPGYSKRTKPYEITIKQGSETYYLTLTTQNNDVRFVTTNTKADLTVTFQYNASLGIVCNFSLGQLKRRVLMERSLYNAEKFIFYNAETSHDGKRTLMYWVVPSSGAGLLTTTTKISEATDFTMISDSDRGKRPRDSPHHSDLKAPFFSFFASPPSSNNQIVDLQRYVELVGAPYPVDTLTVQNLFGLLLSNAITEQLNSLQGPPSISKAVTEILSLHVNDASTFTISTLEEQVQSATVKVKLPADPPSIFGAPAKEITFNVASPRTEELILDMVVVWPVRGSEATFPLSKQLDLTIPGNVLSDFLKAINFSTDIDDVTFSDITLLFAGSFFKGFAAFTSLPAALVQKVASWKVDNFRSEVKTVQLSSEPYVTNAVIHATVPTDCSVVFQDFTLTIKELFMKYPVSSQNYQLAGNGSLAFHSATPMNVEFTTKPPKEATTPEVYFQFGAGTDLGAILSFLQLHTQLRNIYIPFLDSALSSLPILTLGFTLKQGIQESTDTYYISSLSIGITIPTTDWNNLLPSGITSGGSNLACTFLILLPASGQPSLGFAMEFSTTISSAPAIQLQCKASILPTEATTEADTKGYTCYLNLSTASFNQQGRFVNHAKLVDILSAIGFGANPSLSASIPVVSSFLEEISLNEIQITYNTATKSVEFLYLQVAVPKWNMVGDISLRDFELELQYSAEGGWEASLQSDIMLSDSYYIIATFSLPTSSKPGKLSFQNHFESLTISEIFSCLKLPALDQIPVLGSISDVTVKEVTLGLETNGNQVAVYGVKLKFYITSFDLQLFKLTDVNIILAYNKTSSGSEISYRAFGFINETIFVEIAYDPSTSLFNGFFEVASFKTLTVGNASSVFISDDTVAQNTAYDTVAKQPSADVHMTLLYNSEKKSVTLQAFSIKLEKVFHLSYGNFSLKQFSLQYTKKSSQSGSGFELELLAILLQEDGQFGLQLSFDCTISDKDSNTMIAMIAPVQGKKLSLQSFLSLAGVTTPPLPESGSSSNPSPNDYLDLELESGSITFTTSPTRALMSFDVTTAIASNGWVILDDPRIQLSQVKLSVSYSKTEGAKASLFGTFTVGNVDILLVGSKSSDTTTFNLAASGGSSFSNLMEVVNALSPSNENEISIPEDAGFPSKLQGSFGYLQLVFGPEKKSFDAVASLDLQSWNLNLQFVHFTANQLTASLHWEEPVHHHSGGGTGENPDKPPSESTSSYLFKIGGSISFDSIPVTIELNVGSTTDTVVQATINNPSALQLDNITNKTLGFSPEGSSSSTQYSDLLPQGMTSIDFSSGHLQFNLTKKLALLFGDVKDLGTCLLIAGNLKGTSNVGYAVTLTVPELSSLLPPLQPIDSIISISNINASLVNIGNLDIGDLVSAVELAENNLAPTENQFPESSLPFKNLTISSSSATANITINEGLSFYCELSFGQSSSQLIENLITIHQGENPIPSVTLFAHYDGKEPVSRSLFIAKIPTLTLFGALVFNNVTFSFTCDTSKSETSYTLSLSGEMSVQQIPSVVFHGALSVTQDQASFELVGSDQPHKIQAPFGMFGISIKQPRLNVTYNFNHDKKTGSTFHSVFVLRGNVDIYSTPPSGGSGSDTRSPVLTLVGNCIWADGSPTVISIELETVDKPLTLTDLIATVFGQTWDNTQFPDIGFYDGKMYYSRDDHDVTVGDYTYMSGYHISCKTFLFSRSLVFQVDVSLPPDKSGFTVSGSGTQPFDFGIVRFSTKETDDKGNFKNLGPTLTYTHLRSHTDISLGVGINFLDVKVAAINIGFVPSEKAFVFSVTYPQTFLGVKNPSVSCKWSKQNGFQITSWNLGSNLEIPGINDKMIQKFKQLANVRTANGCAAIANFAFRQTVSTKFSMHMETTSKDANDLVAFKLNGTYTIQFGGELTLASIPLPGITVHVPKPESGSVRTMADVATYILETIVSNAGSIVQQVLDNPQHLAKILSVLAFDQLLKQGSQAVIQSLVCRGLTQSEITDAGVQATAEQTAAAETSTTATEAATTALEDAAAGESLTDIISAAGGLAAAAAGLSGLLAGLSGILHFFGKSSEKYDKMNTQYNNAVNALNTVLPEKLTLVAPLTHHISNDQLTLSWPVLNEAPSSVSYNVTLTITSPHGQLPPITRMNLTQPEAQITADDILLASKITVEVNASVQVNGTTYSGKTPLTAEITHQATLPPPDSVTVHTVIADQSLETIVTGASDESQTVQAELFGIDSEGQAQSIKSKHQDTSTSVSFVFPSSDYNSFDGQSFEVKAQCLGSNFQSSTLVTSNQITRLSPPTETQYALPAFEDKSPLINVSWTLPADTTSVHSIVFEIVESTTSDTYSVILSNSVLKKARIPLPTSGSFPLADFEKKVVNAPQSTEYLVCSSLTSNSTSSVGSSVSYSSNKFTVASPPSDVSVSFLAASDTLSVTWTAASSTDEYCLQIIDHKSKEVTLSPHVEANPDKPHQVSYSLSASDMSKLTTGTEYNVQVFSVGSATVLSSFNAAKFPNTISYLQVVQNLSVTYNVRDDEIEVTFDGRNNAKGYTLAVTQSDGQDTNILATFSIPVSEPNKSINYSLPLTRFREHLSESSSSAYGFEARTVGESYDIPSPYVKETKTWGLAESPGSVTVSYNPDQDQVTITCDPVHGFTSYRFMIQNNKSGKKFVKTSSKNPPQVQWTGVDLQGSGGNQFICTAQTVGTEAIFCSKPVKSATTLTRLDAMSTSNPTVYTSNIKSMSLSYALVPHAQSYHSRLDLHRGSHVTTLHTIPNFKPSLSDKDVVFKYTISTPLQTGDSLVVTSYAKGGSSYINSNTSQVSSGPIQLLDSPGPIQMEYSLKDESLSLSWTRVQYSSSYEVECVNSSTNSSIVSKTGIESTSYSIEGSKLTSQGVSTLSISVTAHSETGSRPLLPCKSQGHQVKVDKLVENTQVRRKNMSNIDISWSIPEQWKSKSKDMEVLAVIKDGGQELKSNRTTGDKGSVSISGTLNREQNYTVSMFTCLKDDPIVIGVPQDLQVPDVPSTDFNLFSSRHGSGVTIGGIDKTLVTSIHIQNCVAYTAKCIPVGHTYTLKTEHKGIIRFGLTTYPPNTAPLFKWLTSAIYDPHYWIWYQGNVWNGNTQVPVQYNIGGTALNVGQTVSMAVFPSGELHVYVDGEDKGTPFHNLPTDTPVYGVIGLENDGYNRGSFKLEPMNPAPNFFSSHHGSGVELSANSTTVTSTATDNAVAYTTLPIPLGRIYQLKVNKPGIIRFGLTVNPPASAPLFRWLTDAIWSPDYWEWFMGHVWNDGTQVPVEFNIQESNGAILKVGDTLSMVVSISGELHVFVNGKYMGTPFQNLPTNRPLYGVVGLENFGSNSSFELGPTSLAPNFFSSRHGKNVALKENSTLACNIVHNTYNPFGGPFDPPVPTPSGEYAVAYTALPIAVGTLYQLKVIAQGTLRFGLTVNPPDNAPLFKWLTSAIYDPHYWIWYQGNVWNGNIQVPVHHNIGGTALNVGQTVSMAVYPTGELHVYVDGQDIGTPFHNLPTDTPLYGVMSVESNGSAGSFKLEPAELVPGL